MNPTSFFRHSRFWLALALAASLAGGATWVVAESQCATAESRPAVEVKIDPAPLPPASDTALSFSPIVKRVAPSVVKVVTLERAKEIEARGLTPPFDDPVFREFFGPLFDERRGPRILRRPPQMGLGSGVIVSSDGYILTNNHVVADADTVKVTLADGREMDATVVGKDRKTDIAVIKVEARDLPAITLTDSDKVQVGDRVLALGNPFGLGQTVTTGIVSAKGRAAGIGLDYEDFLGC